MADRRDWEMLQNAIQNTGQGFAQRRAQNQQHEAEMQRIALEQQVKDIEQQRSSSQEASQNRRESAQEGYIQKALGNQNRQMQLEKDRAGALDKQVGLKQATEDFKEAQSAMQSSVQRLGQQVKAGKVTNDEASQYFMGTLDTMPEGLKGKMTSTPEYQMIQSGKFDWATASTPPQPNITKLDSGQPVITDDKGHVKLGSAPPKKPVGYTETKTTPQKDLYGNVITNTAGAPQMLTNTTTRVPFGGAPPAAPALPASPATISPPPSHIQYLKANANDPKVVQDFEAKYGAGSSAQFLQPADQ